MASMGHTYYFVDGSSLIADLGKLRRKKPSLGGKRLSIVKFCDYFVGERFHHLSGASYKRFVVYFVKGESRAKKLFHLPDSSRPGDSEDLQIAYCGKRIQGSKSVDTWLSEHNPPQSVLDRLHRSEKAVDTQICCDALQLACYDRLDRLFLYSNDYDYSPLCNALKANGVNVSLFRLLKDGVNKDLVSGCDSFSVVEQTEVESLFE